MIANLPPNKYLGLGFGQDMINTDMILWQNYGASSLTSDLWSKFEDTPARDAQQDVTSTFRVNADSSVTFRTTRLMDTGDSQDFAINTDTSMVFCYSESYGTSNFVQHSNYGWLAIRFLSDGTVDEGTGEIFIESSRSHFETHGWLLWVSWVLCAYLILASKRYMKVVWLPGQAIHVLLA